MLNNYTTDKLTEEELTRLAEAFCYFMKRWRDGKAVKFSDTLSWRIALKRRAKLLDRSFIPESSWLEAWKKVETIPGVERVEIPCDIDDGMFVFKYATIS